MKKKIGLSVLAWGSLLISISSCDKEDNKTNPVCRINNIVESNGNNTVSRVINYDEGKMASIITAGGDGTSKLFSYTSGMITIITKNSGGVVTGTDEVMLNASGKINSITKKNAAGTVTETAVYLYGGNDKLNMYIAAPAVGAPDTTTLLYSNGNAAITTNKGKNTLYDYYTDKTYSDGDFLKLSQIINTGALALVNENLLKSITSSDGNVTHFTYQYDNTGKITRLLISGAATANYSYTYDCK